LDLAESPLFHLGTDPSPLAQDDGLWDVSFFSCFPTCATVLSSHSEHNSLALPSHSYFRILILFPLKAIHEQYDPLATLTVEVFCPRTRKYLEAYLTILGSADAIIFEGA